MSATAGSLAIDRAGLDELFARARAPRLHARRPDRARPGDRARGARLDRRAARRLDRRAGGRHLPARPPRRRRAVRPQRRPELVEELPVPLGAAGLDRPPGGRRRPRRDRGRHPSPALRVHRRALVRPARDRGAGPRVHRGRLRRPATTSARREGAFIVAVNCGQAAATCFCVSMDTGPKATAGFDLALTEVLEDGGHAFVVEVGSERGARGAGRAARTARREAAELEAAERAIENAAAGQTRSIDTDGIKDLLYRNREHPRWDDVADRCLTCGNCTMVCPTCFCHTVEDVTDLAGEEAERTRLWDSCFTLDHSYIHGGSVHALDEGALPPVDDPQARHLDRPVRDVRAASAAGAASPGARWRSTSPRRRRDPPPTRRRGERGPMQTIDELLEDIDVFRGPGRRAPRPDRGLRAQPQRSPPATSC